MTNDELDQAIDAAAAGPARVRTDDTEAQQHNIADLIEYAKFRRKCNAGSHSTLGIRILSAVHKGSE
jgi:hypothetical protein